jgi:hypothetical protein
MYNEYDNIEPIDDWTINDWDVPEWNTPEDWENMGN